MSCIKCETVPVIKAPGTLIIQCLVDVFLPELENCLSETVSDYQVGPANITARYGTVEELEALSMALDQAFNTQAKKQIRVGTIGIGGALVPLFSSLDEWITRVSHTHLLDLMQERDFYNVIQPIFNLHEQTPAGYEFLLRPGEASGVRTWGTVFVCSICRTAKFTG